MSTICRDCSYFEEVASELDRCKFCNSPRIARHPELRSLSIAHIDCDAFYASIEKRDNPDLKDKPVIVGGGGKHGVVSACCYIARIKGVHSAMPIFQATNLCPEAKVIRPDMEKYRRIGQNIRELMLETTPLVEPLSVDEAFLDLSGTEKIHGAAPVKTLVNLIKKIEHDVGITASIGLSYNKFLSKIASDIDKPRGFAAIGREETMEFLSPQPVGTIWGVGKTLEARLARDGITTIGQLKAVDVGVLKTRYGAIGKRLSEFSRGEDNREVNPRDKTKSISSETTFGENIKDLDQLSYWLWPLCEKVARRLITDNFATTGITLKLKTSSFQIITRARRLSTPTQLAEVLYQAALPLLEKEADGRYYRLIGIGTTGFATPDRADQNNLLNDRPEDLAKIERAVANLRSRFGMLSINKGRTLLKKSIGKI